MEGGRRRLSDELLTCILVHACRQDTQTAEDYLEACIAKQEPLPKVLRLACLLSLTKGIEKKKYDFFKRELIHTYGFEKMFTLNNLVIAPPFPFLSRLSRF
jgi:hypothetical protein